MWWLLSTALAGKHIPAVLPLGCDTQRALVLARDYWEAEGLPPGTVAFEIHDNPMCCGGLGFRPVDAAGVALPGSLALNYDCALLGVSPEPGGGPVWARGVHPLDGPSAPGPTAASLLRPAYAALVDHSDRFEDLLVAVRIRRGWDVWLVRPNEYDLLTVARARFDRDGTLRDVVVDVRPWVPPAGAEAARTVWSLEEAAYR